MRRVTNGDSPSTNTAISLWRFPEDKMSNTLLPWRFPDDKKGDHFGDFPMTKCQIRAHLGDFAMTKRTLAPVHFRLPRTHTTVLNQKNICAFSRRFPFCAPTLFLLPFLFCLFVWAVGYLRVYFRGSFGFPFERKC